MNYNQTYERTSYILPPLPKVVRAQQVVTNAHSQSWIRTQSRKKDSYTNNTLTTTTTPPLTICKQQPINLSLPSLTSPPSARTFIHIYSY